MNGVLNIIKIHVKRNPVNGRWGVYRIYQAGNKLQEMLWTTSIIRKGAIRIAQSEAKKFGVGIQAEAKYV